jgi:DNA-binding winged helix-turn-helix (wHTH) protein
VEEALMESPHYLTFGPFRLDVTHGRLWRGEQPITLRPRSVAVLQYLVEHPGRLLTKAELRGQVWAGTHVTDIVLRVSIREIRAALGDSATTPCYVETVGQQGYRFLGGEPALPPPLTTGPLVGRQRQVAILEQWFQCHVG